MKLKRILIIVGIIGIIILVGFNIYHFGWLKIREKIYQQGLESGINSTVSQIRLEKVEESSYKRGLEDGMNNVIQLIKSGRRINLENGVILFIPRQ